MLSSILSQKTRPPRSARFADSTGRRWEVRELPGKAGATPFAPSLVFETEGVIRRVRSYPANWLELGPVELEALSKGT